MDHPPIPIEQLRLDRIFEIHQGAGNVTISSLTMQNGYHPEAGGALANASQGKVRLENVSVLDSYAGNAGGGIYSGEPIELECPECAGGATRFDLINSTVSGNVTGNEGGGLYIQFGTLNIVGGTISDNQAASGGGLHSAGEHTAMGVPASTTVNGTTISGNVSTGAGGGGINSDHEGSVSIINATISSNTAFDYGGGIAGGSKSELTITGGTITGNVSVGEGGGLYVSAEGGVVITGVQVTNNDAGKTLPSIEVPGEVAEGEGGGGGVYLGGMGPIEVTESNFISNRATGEGGGILIGNNGSVTISHGVVADNVAHGGGGGIENAGRRVTLEHMSIHHNSTPVDGGGILGNGSGDLTVRSSISPMSPRTVAGSRTRQTARPAFERTTIWDNRAMTGFNDDTGLGGGVYGLGDATAHYENVTISGTSPRCAAAGSISTQTPVCKSQQHHFPQHCTGSQRRW